MDETAPDRDRDALNELEDRVRQLEIVSKEANEEILERVKATEAEMLRNRERIYEVTERCFDVEAEVERLRDRLAEPGEE